MNKMKVLLASMRHSYGDLGLGLSYEYYNLLLPIQNLVERPLFFDYMEEIQAVGREAMNRRLLALVESECPDVVIVTPFQNELDPEVMDAIRQRALTVAYFFDDSWRVEFSQFWARHFSYVTTSDINGTRTFAAAGIHNVIYSPFASNTRLYGRHDLPKIYAVTFVGQYHPYRDWCLACLRRAGYDVRVWGPGWKTGILDHESMVAVFNQSRINLNLSNCVSWDLRYLLWSPRGQRPWRAFRNNWAALRTRDVKTREMVKGRHFEINSCGGFQLSFYAEGLERHYQIGEEIAIFASVEDLVDKVRYYLANPDDCERIAHLGYTRTLQDHSMEKRLTDLF